MQTLYTYPENFRAYKILAAANYSGFKITLGADFEYGTTNKTPAFMSKFPMGTVRKCSKIELLYETADYIGTNIS